MNRKQSLASLSEAADNIEDNDDIEYHVHQMDSDRYVENTLFNMI